MLFRSVHVPLSLEAQMEARTLMLSSNNVLSPANGDPIIVPSQDIVLGLYYLSIVAEGAPGEYKPDNAKNPMQGVYGDMGELEHALAAKAVSLHTKIKWRWKGLGPDGNEVVRIYDTTPGRVILSSVLPRHPKIPFDVVNKLMTKKEISAMIDTVYRHCGQKESVIFCDRIMGLGFSHAFKIGRAHV